LMKFANLFNPAQPDTKQWNYWQWCAFLKSLDDFVQAHGETGPQDLVKHINEKIQTK